MATKSVSPDVDALDPTPEFLTLSTGTEVRIERLKTRQLFKLLKIVTVGAGSILGDIQLSADTDPMEFAGQLTGLLISSIPEADDEAIEFIQSMVTPTDLIQRPRGKEQREANDLREEEFAIEMDNPEIEDVISILEAVIAAESGNIQALGKRLAAMFKMNVAQEQVNSSSKKSSAASTQAD